MPEIRPLSGWAGSRDGTCQSVPTDVSRKLSLGSRKTNSSSGCQDWGRGSTFPGTPRGKPRGAPGRRVRSGESRTETSVRGTRSHWETEGTGDGREIGRGSFGIVERQPERRVSRPARTPRRRGEAVFGPSAVFGSHTARGFGRWQPPIGVGSPARHRTDESPERVEASAKAPSGLSRWWARSGEPVPPVKQVRVFATN